MCGLVVANVPVAPAMMALAHRGIRQSVRDVGHGVELGHVRLPIVGLGAEWDQPFRINGGSGFTLAFVGEVLDFRERGWPSIECDLEIVRRNWSRRGVRALTNRDGFWSVVAVSELDGAIHLVVDYLAQKPLYYRTDNGIVGAASEPDAVAALGPVTPDEVYFSAVIKWGYCPDVTRTPYAEVKKTAPGDHVVIHPKVGAVHRETIDPLEPISCTPGELRLEIERAVARRVEASDVPVACLVSGGLDSAIVYRLAQRYGDVTPYHVENDEAEWAQKVVGSRGAKVVRDEWTSTERALAYMQEPLDLGSLMPQAALSDSIGRHDVRVCLTGDGADEFFGGYGRAQEYDSQGSDVFHELVAWHLPRLDRVMMRNRIEVRSPFLARRVAQMALGLPRPLRTGKKILRDLFRDVLGSELADQPKRPLRTDAVAQDRRGNSMRLVETFRRMKWPQ